MGPAAKMRGPSVRPDAVASLTSTMKSRSCPCRECRSRRWRYIAAARHLRPLDVRMHIPEAGHEEPALRVHHARAFGRRSALCDAADGPITNRDRRVQRNAAVDDVDDVDSGKSQRGRLRGDHAIATRTATASRQLRAARCASHSSNGSRPNGEERPVASEKQPAMRDRGRGDQALAQIVQ